MHDHSIERWTHPHSYLGDAHGRNERRTGLVVAFTAVAMAVEIIAGFLLHSMALVADGWHMATHVLALGVAALAYRYARILRDDPRFTFGTGKLGELAGFGSAVVLGVVAVMIGLSSVERLISPAPVAFGEAIPIAVLGFVVNVVSAGLLHGGGHDHAHGPHAHGPHAHGHVHDGDTNMRAAVGHVLADAIVSVLAVGALTLGYLFGWRWLDPAMGLVGTIVIAAWAVSLIRTAGANLLDAVPDQHLECEVRTAVEVGGDRVADLHVWRLGPGHAALILSVVTDHPRPPADYKGRLAGVNGLSHVTVEVNRCTECLPA